MRRSTWFGGAAALLLSATATTSFANSGVFVNGRFIPTGQTLAFPSTSAFPIAGAKPTFGTQPVLQQPVLQQPGVGRLPTINVAPTQAAQGQYTTRSIANGQQQPCTSIDGVTICGASVQGQTASTPPHGAQIIDVVPHSGVSSAPVAVPAAAAGVGAAAVAAPAFARRNVWRSRVYVAPRAHLSFYEDTEFLAGQVKVENDYDVGFGGSIAVGYGQTYDRVRLRTELEIGYQNADIDEHSFSGQVASGDDAGGDTSVGFGFVNAYADYKLTDRFALTAGGGIGIGYVDFDEHAVSGPGILLDDSDTVFGYHIGGGVSVDVAENIAVEALYRYQSFDNADLTSTLGDSTDVDLDSHNIIAGVRVGF